MIWKAFVKNFPLISCTQSRLMNKIVIDFNDYENEIITNKDIIDHFH
jgi:hypothetical protein